jgi:hypothetical protein
LLIKELKKLVTRRLDLELNVCASYIIDTVLKNVQTINYFSKFNSFHKTVTYIEKYASPESQLPCIAVDSQIRNYVK